MSQPPSSRHVGPYTIVQTRPIYENPWIKVREDHVTHREGEAATFGVVTMKPGVSVLPLAEDHTVILVREFKYALGETTLEVISGAIEAGESPEQAGLRELNEECGLKAAAWIDLGTIHPFTTVVHSPNAMFLARGLTKTYRVREAGEHLELVKMSFDDALYAVLRGEIVHGASCVLILKTHFFLEREKQVK